MSDESESHSSYRANLQRAALLRHQGRYADAEKYAQQAIAEQPSNADGYYELAFCYCNWKNRSRKALETIDRAIALAPDQASFLALRAWILGNLDKNKEAIRVAEQALALNPFNILALNAQTRAYSDLRDWAQVEANARHTLEIDATNELAINLLAISLRQQNRHRESEEVITGLLAQVPDSAMAHSNAGWSALQAGDHRLANRHFLEALRLEPDYNHAREGLLHSFNSRVWIYRIYFQIVSWLGRHRTGMRYFFLALIYVAYRFVVTELRREYGEKSLYWVLVVMTLYIILFGFGRSFGNFFLLFDPFARHALTWKEKGWAIGIGILYGCILGIEVMGNAWVQVAVLSAIPAFFLWSVLYPRLRDFFSPPAADELAVD